MPHASTAMSYSLRSRRAIIVEKSIGSVSAGKPAAVSDPAISSASSAVVGARRASGVRIFILGKGRPSGERSAPVMSRV